jgi:hypothetical protein
MTILNVVHVVSQELHGCTHGRHILWYHSQNTLKCLEQNLLVLFLQTYVFVFTDFSPVICNAIFCVAMTVLEAVQGNQSTRK